jgi:hypothetical protein
VPAVSLLLLVRLFQECPKGKKQEKDVCNWIVTIDARFFKLKIGLKYAAIFSLAKKCAKILQKRPLTI